MRSIDESCWLDPQALKNWKFPVPLAIQRDSPFIRVALQNVLPVSLAHTVEPAEWQFWRVRRLDDGGTKMQRNIIIELSRYNDKWAIHGYIVQKQSVPFFAARCRALMCCVPWVDAQVLADLLGAFILVPGSRVNNLLDKVVNLRVQHKSL